MKEKALDLEDLSPGSHFFVNGASVLPSVKHRAVRVAMVIRKIT